MVSNYFHKISLKGITIHFHPSLMEETNTDELTSLLGYGISYNSKKFYKTGPGGNPELGSGHVYSFNDQGPML